MISYDPILTKQIIGVFTVFLSLIAYLPYLWFTIKGKLNPHPFSWILWTLLTGVVFAAQISDNAGPGAWTNASTCVISFLIMIFSIKSGFEGVSRLDKICLTMGLLTIPLWMLTQDALWSVILAATANTFACIPTFTRSNKDPHRESLSMFSLNTVRHGLAAVAMTNYSLITVLFPIVLITNNGSIALFIAYKRWQSKKIKQR